jgi:hypothetical protein
VRYSARPNFESTIPDLTNHRKTDPEREDNNMFSTQHHILDLQENSLSMAFTLPNLAMLTANDNQITSPSVIREVNLIKHI